MTSTATIKATRVRALQARFDYDNALEGFDAVRAANAAGHCSPVTDFEAARVLGEAGGRLSDALGELDDLGDEAGFHAGYESLHALSIVIDLDALVERYLEVEAGVGDCDHIEAEFGPCNRCSCV